MKKIVCIECPNGCMLSTIIEEGKVVRVTGNKCEKGEKYAHEELEHPRRILTTTVLTEGMQVRMLPVRTDRPIPKAKLFEAMKKIRKVRVKGRIRAGNVIIKNLLNTGASLIATRTLLS